MIKSNIKADRKIFEKPNIINSCLATENYEVKCGYYSFSFSVHADDDEQHFN